MQKSQPRLSLYLLNLYDDNAKNYGEFESEIIKLRAKFNSMVAGDYRDFTNGLVRFVVPQELSDSEIQIALEEMYTADRIAKKGKTFSISF